MAINEQKIYAATKADECAEKVIKQLGIPEDRLHLTGQETRRKFWLQLERELISAHVDLSFDSTISNRGIKISGNASGISSDYESTFWNNAWEDVEVTKEELEDYLLENPDIEVYETVQYSVTKTSREKLLKTCFGSYSKHIGIGSCASIEDYHTKLKKDKFGNLLIDKYVLIYD